MSSLRNTVIRTALAAVFALSLSACMMSSDPDVPQTSGLTWLDPGIHLLRKSWIAGSSPAMTL